MIYNIHDNPKTLKEWFLYTIQFIFSVLPATILISSICGTSIAAGLISAGIGTLVFLAITKMDAPVCTSNSGATASAVIGCFVLGSSVQNHFTAVVIGGAIMAIIYTIAALLVKKYGTGWLTKLMPPVVSGTTIIVIGAVLSFYVPTYAQVGGQYSLLGAGIALFTMFITAFVAHYGNGIWKTLPFLVGLFVGYFICIVLTLCNVAPLVDFAKMHIDSIFAVPDMAFFHLDFASFDWKTLPQILVMFGLVSIAAMTEHVADIITASEVSGSDLLTKPGLHRTLLGDGLSSLAGALTGAQCTTTYSEYTGTMAVSGVASTKITLTTALGLIFLGFFTPFNAFLAALPNCVFAGVAICAYGLIAATGLQTLLKADIDFSNNKNRFIIATMLSCGISGLVINIPQFAISGIVLAMIIGIILNLILREERE